MRVWVYIPTGEPNPAQAERSYTDATRTEVDVESLDALLDELTKTAPLRTRVVTFERGTTHYVLGNRGFEKKLRVVA